MLYERDFLEQVVIETVSIEDHYEPIYQLEPAHVLVNTDLKSNVMGFNKNNPNVPPGKLK